MGCGRGDAACGNGGNALSQEIGLTGGEGAFEGLRQTNDHGAEYWSARDLQSLLGYSQWRRFEQAIDRAKTSCEQSGNDPDHHFAGAGKPITGGKGAVQVVTCRAGAAILRVAPVATA